MVPYPPPFESTPCRTWLVLSISAMVSEDLARPWRAWRASLASRRVRHRSCVGGDSDDAGNLSAGDTRRRVVRSG